MKLSDFETQYRQASEPTINQLQTAVILVAQLQAIIANIGHELQNISLTVEDFIAQNRAE